MTDRIQHDLRRKQTELFARQAILKDRFERLAESSGSYEDLLMEQGHIQEFEVQRLDRKIKLTGRAEEAFDRIWQRIEFFRQAIQALEEEAELAKKPRRLKSLLELLRS